MILHKKVADRLLKTGYLDLPLPANPYEIYDPACTDEHYSEFSDFWYFYDPFRQGCEYLSAPPKAVIVRITITATENKKMEEYKQKAEIILAEFPSSDARNSLNLCLEYAASRRV